MDKKVRSNKIVAVILSLTILLTMFGVGAIHAAAAAYPSVTLDVPRISQRPNTGDCAIASIATVEAFMYGYPSGDYTSKIYNAVYEANDYSIGANWYQLGYYSAGNFNMKTAYEQLASGYPVIAYRSSSHYSVVYAYVGDPNNLELSGFMIEDVDDSYNDTNAKKTLTKWVGSYQLGQMVIRKDGLPVPQSKITITCNHPPRYLIKGQTFSICGNIVSKYTIKSVSVSILDSAGKVANSSTYSGSSSSNVFYISNADSSMNFSKLAVGDYTYKIVAKDSSGDSVTYSFKFSVVSGGSSIPSTPTTYASQRATSETTKVVSYTAKVTADPSLNLRSGADETYQVLDSIPKGTTITISAVTKEWGKTSYNGHTGWVKLSYTQEVVTQRTTTTTTTKLSTTQPTTRPSTSTSSYVRTNTGAVMRSSATMFSSNLLTIPTNTILRVLSINGNWYKVSYNGKTGWILYSTCVLKVGDVDSDSKISSTDALVVLKASVGSTKLSDAQKTVADLDGNSKVNSADALIILKIVVGNYN